jgi:hypothetical protein
VLIVRGSLQGEENCSDVANAPGSRPQRAVGDLCAAKLSKPISVFHRFLKKSSPHVFKQFDASSAMHPVPPLLL